MPKAKKKISLVKIGIIFLLLWSGVKLYNFYEEKNAINYAIIPNRTSQEITQEELLSFLPVWSDYTEQNISELGQKPISLVSGNPEDNLSPQAKEWLLRRLWYPKRFFYVEQRLRVILHTLEHQKASQTLIQDLSTQLINLQMQQAQNVVPDPQLASQISSIENMIQEQTQKQNIEQITPQELELIRPLQAVIKETLNK